MSRTKDHLILLQRLQSQAEDVGADVFGSKEAYYKWSMINHRNFNDRWPNDYMHSEKGLALVIEYLENLAHGDIS